VAGVITKATNQPAVPLLRKARAPLERALHLRKVMKMRNRTNYKDEEAEEKENVERD